MLSNFLHFSSKNEDYTSKYLQIDYINQYILKHLEYIAWHIVSGQWKLFFIIVW